MDLCVECKKRPVQNKKRRICYRCYSRLRAKGVLDNLATFQNTPVYHIAETDFIKNYFTHVNWIYQPATFRLNDVSYTPDFYDGESNVFIEVAGTKQAYNANKYKYRSFRETFPLLTLEIRTSNGELLQKDKNGRFIWNKENKLFSH